jgi:hypothetical protein
VVLVLILLLLESWRQSKERDVHPVYFEPMPTADPDALFEQLVERFRGEPDVTLPTPGKGSGFGASALKVNGKIFAMVSKGELIVKLPRKRVDELLDSGVGTRFDPGHGRLMTEWLSVEPDRSQRWPALADEARDYVSGRSRLL